MWDSVFLVLILSLQRLPAIIHQSWVKDGCGSRREHRPQNEMLYDRWSLIFSCYLCEFPWDDATCWRQVQWDASLLHSAPSFWNVVFKEISSWSCVLCVLTHEKYCSKLRFLTSYFDLTMFTLGMMKSVKWGLRGRAQSCDRLQTHSIVSELPAVWFSIGLYIPRYLNYLSCGERQAFLHNNTFHRSHQGFSVQTWKGLRQLAMLFVLSKKKNSRLNWIVFCDSLWYHSVQFPLRSSQTETTCKAVPLFVLWTKPV